MPLWGSPEDEVGLNERQRRELMCEIGRRCYAAKFNDANGGNISCRLDEGRVLCTPTLISKGYMEPSDLVIVDMEGKQIEGHRTRSSEVLLHLYCYKRRPEVKAVIHAHPRNATAFAVTNTPVPKCVIPEIEVFVGEVPITEYADVGTPRLPESLAPYIQDFTVFLLSNHGALSLGSGLIDAFWKMEIIDAYCETILKAMTLGPLSQVSAASMQHIFSIKKSLGIPDRRINDPTSARCEVPAPAPGRPGDMASAVFFAPPATSACPPARSDASSGAAAPGVDENLIRQITQRVLERLARL